MSWTSEFEPPPPRPSVEADDPDLPDATDAESIGSDSSIGEVPSEPSSDGVLVDDYWADTAASSEVPNDGPLDPSIFDGLFADLTPPTDPGRQDAIEAVDLDQLDKDSDSSDEPYPEDAKPEGSELLDPEPEDPEPEDPEPEDQAGDPAPPIEPTPPVEPIARPEAEPPLDGFDPEETLFEVDLETDQTHEGSDFGALQADGFTDATLDPTSTISVNGEAPVEPVVPHHPLELPRVTQDQPAFAPDTSAGVNQPAAPSPYQPQASVPPQAQAAATPGNGLGTPAGPPPRRARSFILATLIGASLGVAGAVLLSQVVGRSGSDEITSPTSIAIDGSGAVGSNVEPGVDAVQETPPVELGANGHFNLNGLRFEPGTLSLSEAGQATLAQVAAVTLERPDAAISVVVRTYSEPTAEDNLTLSRSQAQVIVDSLMGLGVAPDAISGIGIGAPTLNPSQPVQNFVVVGAGLQSSALKSAIKELSPFAIGIDPATNQLRSESIASLNLLGTAMTADPSTSVSLAAYAYERADADRNQAVAATAAETAAAFLVANHQVDPSRIALLTPGQAPYVVAVETGNHISLEWGDLDQAPMLITEADQLAVSFAPGSVLIEAAAAEALDRVAVAAAESGASFVIDVHTATEPSANANSELGKRQAAAIVDHLAQAGLGDDRVKAFSGGNLRQFTDGEAQSRVVITPVR